MKDDIALIIGLKNGNHAAFEELYNRYWRNVHGFASLYITDKDDIREVVQDVFVNVWQSRERIRENENFKGLLFIATRNLVFNRAREKRFDFQSYQTTIENALSHAYRIDYLLEAKELETEIDRLIAEMPKQRQLVFTLSRKEHKTHREIANELGIAEKTVERHINEALRFLKANLTLLAIFFYQHF